MALQRTRRPRFRSGRWFRSLGSPLNARSFGVVGNFQAQGFPLKPRMRALVTLVAWVSATAIFAADDPSTWSEFSPTQGRFGIRMPGTPTEQSLPGTAVHNFQLTDGDQSFVVSFADLPPELRKAAPREILEGTQAGFLRLLPGSKLIGSKTVRIGESPGVTCVIEAKAPGRPEFRLKMTAVLVRGRLFSFGFISRKDLFVESEVDKYLATFRLK